MPNRILVINATARVTELLCDWLEHAGYWVDAVPTAERALGRICRFGAPDLIWCSLLLPGMDGVTFAMRLSSLRDDWVPLVLLARSCPRTLTQRLHHAGRWLPVLTSPFTADHLAAGITQVLMPRMPQPMGARPAPEPAARAAERQAAAAAASA